MQTLKLFGSLRSPFVRRIRILLEELRLDYEYDVTDVFQPTAAFVAHAPLERVPLLIINNAATLHDSHEMQAWLAAEFPHHELFSGGHGGILRRLSLSSLAAGAMDFCAARFIEGLRAPAQQNHSNLRDFESCVRRAFTVFNRELSGEQKFLSGGVMRAEDVDVAVAGDYADLRLGLAFTDAFPHVKALMSRVSSRASFMKTKPVL